MAGWEDALGGAATPQPVGDPLAAIPEPLSPTQHFRDQWRRNEGRRSAVYNDTLGNPTIGEGFNLNRAGAPTRVRAAGINFEDLVGGKVILSDKQIDAWAKEDITDGLDMARRHVPDFDNLDQDRQLAIFDMTTMGETTFSSFRGMLEAVNRKDWTAAAGHMIYRDGISGAKTPYAVQLPHRSRRNADGLMRGKSQQQLTAQREQDWRLAMRNSADQNKEISDLAGSLGLQPETVSRNLSEAQQQFTSNSWQAALGDNRTTARKMDDDRFLAVAHDDAPALVQIEQAAKDVSFTGSFSRGVDILQQLGYRTLEATGELVGSETLAEIGAEGAEQQRRDLIVAGEGVNFTDISSAGDFYDWMIATAGEQIPLMAPSLAGGAAGGALGLLGGPAAPVTVPLGAMLGAFIPSLVLGVGETQQAIKERDPEAIEPELAFGAGAAIAALDSILPGRVVGTLRRAFGKEGAKELVRNWGRKVAAAGAKGATIEAITEATQEAISETTAAFATDTKINVADLANQMINAAAAGAFMGGGVTTITEGSVQLTKSKRVQRSLDLMHAGLQKSKLRTRDPEQSQDHTTAVMEDNGVETVEVNAEALLEAVENSAEETGQLLEDLGVSEEITDALEVEGGTVTMISDSFVAHVLGKPLYEVIRNDIGINGQESPMEAAQGLADIGEFLTAAVAKKRGEAKENTLLARTEKLVKQLSTPEGALEALATAAPDVKAELAQLVEEVTKAETGFAAEQTKARLTKIDEQIANIDKQIADSDNRAQIESLEARREALETEEQQLSRPQPTQTTRPSSEVLRTTVPADAERVAAAEAELTAAETQRAGLEDKRGRKKQTGKKRPFKDTITKANKRVREAKAALKKAQEPTTEGRPGRTAPAEKPISLKAKTLDKLENKTTRVTINAVKRGFREGARAKTDQIKAIQGLLTTVVKKSGLEASRAAKFITRVQKLSAENFAQDLARIRSQLLVDLELQRKAELKRALKKQLKAVANKKRKLTPTTQKIIDGLTTIMRMDAKEAAAILAQRKAASIGEMPSAQEFAENLALQVIADPRNASSNQLETLLLEVFNIVNEGKRINVQGALAYAAKVDALRTDMLEALGPERGPRSKVARLAVENIEAKLLAWNGVWADKMRRVFTSPDAKLVDSIMEDIELFDEARAFEQGKIDMTAKLLGMMQARMESLTERDFVKLLHAGTTEEINFGEHEHSDGTYRNITMTRSELRQRVMEMRNDKLRQQAMAEEGNAYTPGIIDALEAELTEQDVYLIEAQLEFHNEYYERINEAYERAFNVSLPKIDVYVPIKREIIAGAGVEDEFLTTAQFLGGGTPGALKARVGSTRPLLPASDLARWASHMQQMEYFIHYNQKVKLLNDVFDGAVNTRIRRNFGNNFHKTINKDIAWFSNRGISGSATGENLFVSLMRKFSFAQLGSKPQIGLKQLASFAAYSENVNVAEFSKGMVRVLANPIKAARFMTKNSSLFRNRGINIDRDFQEMVKEGENATWLGRRPRLTKVIMAPIRYGDKGALLLGGFAHIKAMQAKGATLEQAVRSFEKLTARTQQSADTDQISELQRTSGFARVLTQFMSSANALTRAEYRALAEGARGRISKKELAKRLTVYHLIIPNIITLVANGFRWDDEDQLRASLLGTLNGVFVLGDVVEMLVAVTTGGENFFSLDTRHPLSFMTDVVTAVQEFDADDMTWDDFIEGNRAIDRAARAAGAATGVPVATILNQIRGLALIGDETPEGILLILGWSPYIVNKEFD